MVSPSGTRYTNPPITETPITAETPISTAYKIWVKRLTNRPVSTFFDWYTPKVNANPLVYVYHVVAVSSLVGFLLHCTHLKRKYVH